MKVIKTTQRVPQTDIEIADLIRKIGEVKNDIEKTESDFKERVADMEEEKNWYVRKQTKQLILLQVLVFHYLESNRDRLITDAGKKTIEFDTGKAGWRLCKPFLHLGNEERIIARLENMGLHDLVKIQKSIKKGPLLEWLKANAGKKIRGVRLDQWEELYLHPNQTKEGVNMKRSELPQLEFKLE